MKKPELLCPVGGPDTLQAALLGGADAVYFGGKAMNARMNAKNFDDALIPSVIQRCHEKGVRVYVTLNTLVPDRALDQALFFAEGLNRAGCDGLIVADLGLAALLHQNFPALPLHASTQASGHSLGAAQFFREHGFSRMVLAREMDRENLAALCKASPLETEVFVHGALCASASGQCLMSSMIGDRSGNRGECAQPCRLPYAGAYPLSFRDLSLARHVTELLPMGIASFKIEGRMKSPEYVYTVASVWRRLIDEGRNATEQEMEQLSGVFSRSGFTDGYFTRTLSAAMLGRRTDQDKDKTRQSRVPFREVGRAEAPLPTPCREEKAEKVVLPPRETVRPGRSARFQFAHQIPEGAPFDPIYLPLARFDEKKANGVVLPPVIFPSEEKKVRKELEAAWERGARHALVGNVGHFRILEGLGFVLHGDFRLNVVNSFSLQQYAPLADVIVSPELNSSQIRDLQGKKSVIVYGRIPVMLLEKPLTEPVLRDRRGVCFPVLSEGGRSLVVNSVPLYMGDKKKVLREKEIFHQHFLFTVESREEVGRILAAYQEGLAPDFPVKRIK